MTTLIDLVQDILADADGDEVNTISDTIESDQCARVIRDSFRNIVDIHDLSAHKEFGQLDATSSTTPTQMNRPDGLYAIEILMYDKRILSGDAPAFLDVIWMDPVDFMKMVRSRTKSDSDVTEVALTSGVNYLVKNDQAPTYYTQLEGYDEFHFDSYDSALETNLQTSKVSVYGMMKPTLSLTSTAVIDLPEHLMTLLRNDARAFFFDLYKDGVTKEVNKRQRQSETRAQRQRHISKDQSKQTGRNYGRRGRRSTPR